MTLILDFTIESLFGRYNSILDVLYLALNDFEKSISKFSSLVAYFRLSGLGSLVLVIVNDNYQFCFNT